MPLPTEDSAQQFLNIVADVPLNVTYPLYDVEELEVIYGLDGLKALYPADFTVELSEPDFDQFTITPTATMLSKINALIAANDEETNFIVVRRKLDFTTSVTPDTVRQVAFLSREIERIHMKLIQLQESQLRKIGYPASVIGDASEVPTARPPVEGYAPVWRDNVLVPEINATNIAAAQENAEDALAALQEAEDLLDDMQAILVQVNAAAALLPLNNYTAVTDPTVNDDVNDGYTPGSQWVNTLTGDRFFMSANTAGAAVWQDVTGIAPEDLGTMAFEAAADYQTVVAAAAAIVTARQIPQNSKSADYTLVLGDAGGHILHPTSDGSARVFTIPSNASVAYPIGTALTFVNQNGAGGLSIAIDTDTMRLAGAGTTGTRTLAANGIATALKITATEWIISGTGLT